MSILQKVLPKTLSAKLLGVTLILSTLSLGSVGWFSYKEGYQSLEEAKGNCLAEEARSTAKMVDRFFYERVGDVDVFSFVKQSSGTPEEVREGANFFAKSYGIYDLIIVADATGKVIATNTLDYDGKAINSASIVGRNVRDEEWFSKCISGAVDQKGYYVKDLHENALVSEVYGEKTLGLIFAKPIFDQNGKIIRVLSNHVSAKRTLNAIMQDSLRQMKASGNKTAEVQVISKDGTVLFNSDPSLVFTQNLLASGLKAAQLACSGKNGYVTELDKQHGRAEVIGYAQTEGQANFKSLGWGILLHQARDETVAPAGRIATVTTATGAVSLALVTLVTFGFATSVVKPLKTSLEVFRGVVAAGTREMTTCVREIARNSNEAVNVAGKAVVLARDSNATIAKLTKSSEDIGTVLKVITSIAQQTNLLALNATIEAARAGETGRGFAVVANEVKELAKETGKATEDIGQKINTIQTDTKRVVESIEEITAIIQQINDFQTTIVSAVEEQSATTAEISRNLSEAARGTTDIAQKYTQTNPDYLAEPSMA